jgi:predicted  nucleic acid-binding Zn-ribbon protein
MSKLSEKKKIMAKEQKQVCDIRPGKGMSIAQSNEHLRIAQEGAYTKKVAGTMDPTREHLNFEISRGGVVKEVDKSTSIPKRIKDILKERGIHDPNAGLGEDDPNRRRTVANIILQGSRDTMLRLAFGEQEVKLERGADNSQLKRNPEIEQWAVDMYNFVSKKYGEENIAAFVVHLDETCPHIHCTLLPLTKMNKFSWKEIFAGKDKYEYSANMKKLHDELAEVNEKYGLHRGDSVLETGAQHKSYLQWLKEQVASNKVTIKEQIQTIDENKEQLYLINAAIKRADTKLKGLTTMIKNLENKKQQIDDQIKALDKELENGKASNREELEALKQKLNAERKEIEANIADKNEKLKAATSELQDLAQRKAKLKENYDELQRKVNKELPTIFDKGTHDMSVTLWEETVQNFKKDKADFEQFSRELPPNLRVKFDNLLEDSVLVEMADHGNQIAATAAALFLGFVDKATNYAESNGGGGASPGTGWGRKEDEDEEAYKRRCCIMGRIMMRPAGRKLKRS